MFFKLFYPYEYVDDVFSIDYEKLFQKGYRGIIFDIDNTLVHHGDDSNETIDSFFKMLQSVGFKTLLLSNNSEARVQRFIRNIDTLYIANAKKPLPGSYRKAVKKMNCKKEEVVFIGDQIFTDIFGANMSRIACILVKFIRLGSEVDFGKRRRLEKVVLDRYFKSKSAQNRLGDIKREKKTENGGI